MEHGDRSAERPVRTFVATLSLLTALLFGGMAIGFAIGLGPGGGSVGAIVVGFFALPLVFGLGMTAWRGVVGAWMIGGLVRAVARSRGDEQRFREEAVASYQRLGGVMPGTWVFLPTAVTIGAAAAAAMFVLSDGNRLLAGFTTFAACVGYGLVLRRLARSGLLPIPEE